MMDYYAKLHSLLTVVGNTKDIRARSDLYKVYNNCKKLYDALDRESVECRRLRRTTLRYTELELALNESITEFEQWITYATLLYG
jgi:hypothetical protein